MELNRSIAQRVTDLESLVKSGRSFKEAVDEIAPHPRNQTTLMRRASAAGAFDQPMFDAVIGAGLKIPFEDFIRTFGVERTQSSSEAYRVADSVAADYLEGWVRENRKDLIRFTSDVYTYLMGRTDKPAPLEILRFRIPSDPSGGLSEFDQMFDESDRAFDLATCHAMVQMLRELDNFSPAGGNV